VLVENESTAVAAAAALAAVLGVENNLGTVVVVETPVVVVVVVVDSVVTVLDNLAWMAAGARNRNYFDDSIETLLPLEPLYFVVVACGSSLVVFVVVVVEVTAGPLFLCGQ